MSNLKELILDFDISGPPIKRKSTSKSKIQDKTETQQPQQPPETPKTTEVTETTEVLKETTKKTSETNRRPFKLVHGFFLLIFFLAIVLFLLSHNERERIHTTCAYNKNTFVCHFPCDMRGFACNAERLVTFHSNTCANEVRTIHTHFKTHFKRFPAYLLRVKNTTSFSVAGKRVVFSPSFPNCRVSVHQQPFHGTSGGKEFKNKLVWVSDETETRFELRKHGAVVASVQAESVLYKKISSNHLIYTFPLRCDGKIRVFGKKEIETFEYCD